MVMNEYSLIICCSSIAIIIMNMMTHQTQIETMNVTITTEIVNVNVILTSTVLIPVHLIASCD